MKKLFLTITVLLSFTMNCLAQELCESFSMLRNGTHLEYTDYDKKGKAISKSSHTTSQVVNEGQKISAKIKIESSDIKKQQNTFSSEYEISCKNGVLSIDMQRFFDNNQLSQFSDTKFDVEISGDALDFPADGKSGDILNNGSLTIKVSTDGVAIITTTMNISNRTIGGTESISTDAGTFSCKVISYDFDTKAGFVKVKGSAKQWFTADQVMVKSENYNKNGKLLSVSKLTNYKK